MSALYLSSMDGRIAVRGDTRYRLANTQTYSEWLWDGTRLRAHNCRLGVHPLFWRERANGIALATSPLDLLEDGAELDYAALAVFLRLGFFVGEDTPFAGIRHLAPGSELSWDAARGARLRETPLPRGDRLLIDRDTAMERYAALMRRAVANCFPLDGRLCIPLSGGRDSRHIALALHALGVKPHAYVTLRHLPGRSDEDARIAALVARALDAPHIVLAQPRFCVPNMLRNLHDSAMCADEGAQLPPLTDWLRLNADMLFDGIGGDVMSAGLFQNAELHALYVRGDLHAVAGKMFHDWQPSVRGWQYAADKSLAGRLSEGLARERLIAELERHQRHRNPARAFYFWNRTRREIALQPFALFSGLCVETPYLDAEVWDFLDGLPYEMVADQRFHTDTILRGYPAHAAIPFETKGQPHRATRMQRMLFGASLAPTLLRYGGWHRPPLMLRWLRSLVGVRVWWNPNMLLYMLTLLRISKEMLRAPVHDRDRTPEGRSMELRSWMTARAGRH